tara:strand:- start:2016 stop:2468 length:453 start_codon:yes stop_codon:yes gene_type:complete
MTSVFLIPKDHYSSVKDDVEALITKSIKLSDGRDDFATVWNELQRTHQQLWMVFDSENKPIAALLTSIKAYALKRMFLLQWLGGEDMDDWLGRLLDTLAAFAKANSCAGMEIVGREGWKRALRDRGWEANLVVCTKYFDEEAVKETRDAA